MSEAMEKATDKASAVSAALANPEATLVLEALRRLQPALTAALPAHLKAERMIRIALTAVRKNPKLVSCDLKSFVGAIMQAAQLGLEPDGTLGEAYLIPYGRECQLVCGYKGLLKLARQSGQISTIVARAVHAKDRFVFEFGLTERLEHTPSMEEEPGDLVWVYAIARLRDGGVQADVMSRADVNRIRDKSQGYRNAKRFNSPTPWDEHYDEMAKKTVLRRLCKMLPASVELARAVALDEAADAGFGQGVADVLAIEGVEVPDGDKPIVSAADVVGMTPEGKRMSLKGKLTPKPQAAAQAALDIPPPATSEPEREPGQDG